MKTTLKLITVTLVLLIMFMGCSKDIDDEEFSDFRNIIQEAPEIVEEDLITNEFVSPEGDIYYTGSFDCTSDGSFFYNPSNTLLNLHVPDSLPTFADLSPMLPPIGDQGRQGSCVSWAVTYYLKSYQERLQSPQGYDSTNIMSPAYTYNQLTLGECEGTAIESTLTILKEKGSATLNAFPYNENNCSIQPTANQDSLAQINKIGSYKYLSGYNMVTEMKTLINDSIPIIISAFLTPEFGKKDDLGLTAYRDHSRDFRQKGGCHAMLVVGYSDNYNAFKVVNSWGEEWGNNGFVWIDYLAFANVHSTSSSFKVISSAMVAYDL